MPKKICILTSGHYALDVRVFHKEAISLARAGYEVAIIGPHRHRETINGVSVIPFPRFGSRFLRFFLSPLGIFWMAFWQGADVYHFHDPELILCGFVLKVVTGKKVIYDSHEEVAKSLLDRNWLPKPFRPALSFVFDKYEKKLATKFDYIIAAGPDLAQDFRAHKIQKIAEVRNYAAINSNDHAPFKQFPRNESCLRLVYAGGLAAERGIKEIIKATSLVSEKHNVRLILMGKFHEAGFEAEIKSLPEWKQVDYRGEVSFSQVRECLKSCDVGLACFHPTDRFLVSLPIKMFEYMAAGLPIIVSDFPFWKGIVEKNRCGLHVDPLDAKAIATAAGYLLANPQKAVEMGVNGRKAALSSYSWEAESKKLLKAYEEIVR